jgi:hypothetical protein
VYEVYALQQQRVALHCTQARQSQADGARAVRGTAGKNADFGAVEAGRLDHGRHLRGRSERGKEGGGGGGKEGGREGGRMGGSGVYLVDPIVVEEKQQPNVAVFIETFRRLGRRAAVQQLELCGGCSRHSALTGAAVLLHKHGFHWTEESHPRQRAAQGLGFGV